MSAAANPLLYIVIGIVILMMGRRLAVLGAAVGAMLAVLLLRWMSGTADLWVQFGIVVAFTIGGFILAGLTKGIVDIVLLVICAIAGAEIVLGVIDIFRTDLGWLQWLLALIGGIAGVMIYRGSKEFAMVLLSGLIGALLITRGLSAWLPFLQGFLGTVLFVVLAGAGVGSQSGYFAKRKAAKAEQAAATAPSIAAAPVAASAVETPPAPAVSE